jgi:hypothetical protein
MKRRFTGSSKLINQVQPGLSNFSLLLVIYEYIFQYRTNESRVQRRRFQEIYNNKDRSRVVPVPKHDAMKTYGGTE